MRSLPLRSMETLPVVDDEAEMAERIALFLDGKDLDVLTVVDGLEALGKARKEQPWLVITDLMMSRMNGLAWCLRLHEAPDISEPSESTSSTLADATSLPYAIHPFASVERIITMVQGLCPIVPQSSRRTFERGHRTYIGRDNGDTARIQRDHHQVGTTRRDGG